MSLIPTIALTDFKRLTAAQLKRLKSCEVTADGAYLFTFTNPATDYIRREAENKCQLSNAVHGETLEQIIGRVPVHA